jgi:hypothetical protein
MALTLFVSCATRTVRIAKTATATMISNKLNAARAAEILTTLVRGDFID